MRLLISTKFPIWFRFRARPDLEKEWKAELTNDFAKHGELCTDTAKAVLQAAVESRPESVSLFHFLQFKVLRRQFSGEQVPGLRITVSAARKFLKRFRTTARVSVSKPKAKKGRSRDRRQAELTGTLKINQFHFCVSSGDAVTNHMLFLRDALQDGGAVSELFACELKGEITSQIKPFSKEALENCDLLLIHHSTGNPRLQEILDLDVPKALVYHNITPAPFFTHDPYLQELAVMGREQLAGLARAMPDAFAVSHFNAIDLEGAGFKNVRLLPLVDLPSLQARVHLARSLAAAKSPAKKKSKSARLLFVGKVTPHKNQGQLVEVMYFLRKLTKSAQLSLLGGEDPLYGRYVRGLIDVLQLDGCIKLLGKVSDAQWSETYRSSDALICLSRHEGFCVPILEAMAFGLPVFSYSENALRETIGGKAIEIKSTDSAEIAFLLHSFLRDPARLATILEVQQTRLLELVAFQNKSKAREILWSLAGIQPLEADLSNQALRKEKYASQEVSTESRPL